MNVVCILGPLGSGKTTLLNRILAHPELGSRFGSNLLVVVNDVGTINIDAKRLEASGQEVTPLTAGCVGCADLPTFRRVCTKAIEDGVTTLFLEPTGIADGQEVLEAIRVFQVGWSCLTLLDLQHHKRNQSLGTVGSQLSVATCIGLTWVSPTGDAEASPGWNLALHDAGRHAPNRPIIIVPREDAPVSSELMTLLGQSERLSPLVAKTPSKKGYLFVRKPHAHVHGVYAVSEPLRSEVTIADLLEVLATLQGSSQLVRSKGVVGGREFDYVQGDVTLGMTSTLPPHANIIAQRPLDKAWIQDRIGTAEFAEERLGKKTLLTQASADIASTEQAIIWLSTQYPSVHASDGSIRVDTEADAILQLIKRTGVSSDVRARAICAAIDWRMSALHALPTTIPTQNRAHEHRRLGVVLTWFACQEPNILGADRIEEINRHKTASLLMTGLQHLHELAPQSPFGDVSEESPLVIGTVFRYGVIHQGLDRSSALQTIAHMRTLARQMRPDTLPAWETLLHEFSS